ncbi:MAG: GNAT family N-acetyltransferase, partial [Phenylobacterium sp.]
GGRGAEPQPDAGPGGGLRPVILRRATAADAVAIGRLHHRTMRTSPPFLPELHTPDEATTYVADKVLPACEVWVAEADGELAGYIVFRPGWIDQLYVHPDRQGQGIGPRLLAQALADRAPRRLWTFQKNARARRFYEGRGFAVVEFTDGAGNEEQEPDVLYEWRP